MKTRLIMAGLLLLFSGIVQADAPAKLSSILNEAWSGELDGAVEQMRDYLDEHPDDAGAWLHLSDFETWRGNYAGALDALAAYRELSGEDDAFLRRRARIMAWAGRRDEAMALVEPLLERHPDDPDLHFTRTLALRSTQPRQAMTSLARVEALAPEAADTTDLARSTRMPYRPRLGLGLDHFRDSDGIRISTLAAYGSFFHNYDTKFMAGVQRRRAEADAGTGLEPAGGDERIEDSYFWAGIGQRLSPNGWLEFRLGRDDVDDRETLDTYAVAGRWRAADATTVSLTYEKELVAISPRTISNMLDRKRTEARLNLRPALSHSLNLGAGYHDFGDGNRRRSADAAYRYAAVRSQNWNIDVGLAGGWFSFSYDFNAGYYAPESYRYLAATTGTYWKIDDDNGIGLNLALGGQEDETFDRARFYGDASIEGIFGIYRHWMLHVRAAYSDRRQQTGSFDASRFSVTLERRF